MKELTLKKIFKVIEDIKENEVQIETLKDNNIIENIDYVEHIYSLIEEVDIKEKEIIRNIRDIVLKLIEAWVDIDELETDDTQRKDKVEYVDMYFSRDNTISRWLIQWEQRLWLSNIEKDWIDPYSIPQFIIEERKNETIRWFPREESLTIREYKNRFDKKQISLSIADIYYETKEKWLPVPSLKELYELWISSKQLEEIDDRSLSPFDLIFKDQMWFEINYNILWKTYEEEDEEILNRYKEEEQEEEDRDRYLKENWIKIIENNNSWIRNILYYIS